MTSGGTSGGTSVTSGGTSVGTSVAGGELQPLPTGNFVGKFGFASREMC